jgi:K+-transporting ATPase A subunit
MRSLEYIVFLALVVGLAWPVGLYLARVFEGQPTFLDPALRPIESLLYRLFGVHRGHEMTAGVYTLCFLLFSAVSIGGLFFLLLVQHWLPGGPADHYLTRPMTTAWRQTRRSVSRRLQLGRLILAKPLFAT